MHVRGYVCMTVCMSACKSMGAFAILYICVWAGRHACIHTCIGPSRAKNNSIFSRSCKSERETPKTQNSKKCHNFHMQSTEKPMNMHRAPLWAGSEARTWRWQGPASSARSLARYACEQNPDLTSTQGGAAGGWTYTQEVFPLKMPTIFAHCRLPKEWWGAGLTPKRGKH